jgi:hypothetical protein
MQCNMSAIARLARVAVLTVAFASVGCVSIYKPPTASQPHAVLKLRRVYQSVAGTRLDEAVSLEEHAAFSASDSPAAAMTPRIDALLVHPTPAHVNLSSQFSHQESRLVQQSYTVQIPYTQTESYSCGYGTRYQTCTRTVTHYRSETRYRMVMQTVDVSDGACMQSVWLAPLDGHTYLLDLTYRGPGMCTLLCYEQRTDASQQLVNAPCPIVNVVQARVQ